MVSLKDVVLSFMNRKDYNTEQGYSRYFRMAVEGMQLLQWDLGGQASGIPKEVRLEVDTVTKTANIPEDFIHRIIVGVETPSGKLIPLIENNNLSLLDRSCTDPEVSSLATPFVSGNYTDAAGHYSVGEYIGRDYNAGAQPTLGEFRINNGQIYLSLDYVYSTVVLRYVSKPTKLNGKFMIHDYLKEPLIYYLDWQDVALKSSVSEGVKREKQRQFASQKRLAYGRLKGSFTPQEAAHAHQTGGQASPKL